MINRPIDLHRRRSLANVFQNPRVIKRILRLVMALVFALPAFIFSELVPEIQPFNRTLLRALITIWFAALGYGLFPDLAKLVTFQVIALLNAFTNRISSEIVDRMVRIPAISSASINNPTYASSSVTGMSVSRPLILDTSAIIDGRILDIAKTNFITGSILLPHFVLIELQQVADSSDYIKRSRGRRGFEVIADLKKVKGIHLEIWENEPAAKNVDEKLIKLAKALNGKLITTDFNLNKVATFSNVPVLNVNDLANAVKTVAIPGEVLKIKVVHLGKDPKQGVGYLPDGTMIVVENGAQLVGKEVETEVSRVLQGSAGRMIFTKFAKA